MELLSKEELHQHVSAIEHLWDIGEFPHVTLEELFFDTVAEHTGLRLDTDEERIRFLHSYFLKAALDKSYLDYLVQTSK